MRCSLETMVQFMEAAMSAIATGTPFEMRVGQVRRTGSMRALDENEKKQQMCDRSVAVA